MLNLSVGGEITLLRWVGFYEKGYSRSFFSKTFEKHLYLVCFFSKTFEKHPYLACFSQKRLRNTRISNVFQHVGNTRKERS